MFGLTQHNWLEIGVIVIAILGLLTCLSAYQVEKQVDEIEQKIDRILHVMGIRWP